MSTEHSLVDDFVACLILVGLLWLAADALGWLAKAVTQ